MARYESVKVGGVGVKPNGKEIKIDLEVVPIKGTAGKEAYYVILFHEILERAAKVPSFALSGRGKTLREASPLKEELAVAKQERSGSSSGRAGHRLRAVLGEFCGDGERVALSSEKRVIGTKRSPRKSLSLLRRCSQLSSPRLSH